MSPSKPAKAAPATEAPTPEATEEVPTQEAGEFNPFVHGLLTQAKALSDKLRGKGGLYEQIAANRDLLRNVKLSGLLSAEQATAIDEFYPVRKARAEGEAQAAEETAATA